MSFFRKLFVRCITYEIANTGNPIPPRSRAPGGPNLKASGPRPGALGPRPLARGPGPKARSPGPGTRAQDPGARGLDPGPQGPGPGPGAPGQGPRSCRWVFAAQGLWQPYAASSQSCAALQPGAGLRSPDAALLGPVQLCAASDSPVQHPDSPVYTAPRSVKLPCAASIAIPNIMSRQSTKHVL